MKRILSFTFVFTFLLAMLMPASAFAATVGQQLNSPETGWQRIDDTNNNIAYFGMFAHHTTIGTYNNTETYFTTASSANSIKLKFKGTQLRLIGNLYESYPKPITVTIDGVSETYSAYNSTLIRTALLYQKMGLVQGVHNVTITFDSLENLGELDAIDIDSAGSLISIYQPTGLQAASGSSQVALTWDAVQNATSYNVKRSTTPGGPYTTTATNITTNSFTDTSVINGTTYYYVVSSVVSGSESTNSSEASATPQVPAPTAPTNLTAAPGNAQVSLAWDTVQRATSYIVERSTTSGGPYTTIANTVTGTTYTDISVTPGTTYYYVIQAVNAGGTSDNSNEASVDLPSLNPELNVVIAEDIVKVGQEFTASIELKNVQNIYAEDFTIQYDNTLFDYLGFEEIPGYKVYNQPTDQNGTLRFIVASQGQAYGISSETVFLKLKLKAKAVGTGKVDATKCRLADTTKEFDLDATNCMEDTVTVENSDVNMSGEYTLLDLAIDGYYYGLPSSSTDTTNHVADQTGDAQVADDDLVYIVGQMLANTNYAPNN